MQIAIADRDAIKHASRLIVSHIAPICTPTNTHTHIFIVSMLLISLQNRADQLIIVNAQYLVIETAKLNSA